MADEITLSPVEIDAFNNLQRQFNRMVREIIEHRGEDATKQWHLLNGILIKEKSQPKPHAESMAT